MARELTVTAKGQVTLRGAVLDHLGVRPGAKVSVSLLENGRVELVASEAGGDIKGLRGALRRPGRPLVSLEEMQRVIEEADGRRGLPSIPTSSSAT
ncbi:MAG: AbrB/MazE/SpoVT family DNA-binding domain-containing protein [Stellaceae bacterium]